MREQLTSLSALFRFPGMRKVGDNLIHETALIGPEATLGRGNFVGPYTAIVGNVAIGDDNWIGPNVIIGTAAQYHGSRNEWKESSFGPVRIGNRNVLREFVTVHEPSKSVTAIEDDCMLMAYNHVSHDTVLRSRVTLANNVQIGGFTEIQFGCVVGLSTTVHQFTTIGAFSMIGMSSVVVKDLPPFLKWAGNPIRCLGPNVVGLERHGFPRVEIDAISNAFRTGATYPSTASHHMDRFSRRNDETRRPVAKPESFNECHNS